MKLIDLGLSFLIPGLILVHLLIAPYTKVEESFNIQATHDVLVYGTPTSNINGKLTSSYDHFSFPGAVPRTFIGPVMLAGFAQPVVRLLGFEHAQLVVRAILGLFNAGCLLLFRRNLARAYGTPTARWYTLLQASQFHIIFYASRTLPNMFAFGLTTAAFAFLIPHPNHKKVKGRQRQAIALFVFAAAIFRSEIAVLLATSALWLLIIPQTSLDRLIPPFAISFIMALALSIPIDSYFWQKPLWPELWGFYYNAVLGSSSNWGVSPWHYYFTSAVPRLLLNPLVPLVLIPTALLMPATQRGAKNLVYPSLLFAVIYSIQPHKETRFIFYVVPPMTAAAALGANYLFSRRTKSALSALVALVLCASILVSFAVSFGMLLLSSLNYPGGEALAYLRDMVQSSAAQDAASALVPVHADVLACMTGVTLFGTVTSSALPSLHGARSDVVGANLREPGSVTLAVDKTEDESLLQEDFWTRFDYLLMEDRGAVKGGATKWETIGVVQGYGGVEILKPGQDDRDVAAKIVGNGVLVRSWKQHVRDLTGGWWIGPRMVPRIYIMKRVKESERTRKAADS